MTRTETIRGEQGAPLPASRRRLLALALLFGAFGSMGGVWASRLPTLKARLDLTSSDIGAALFCAAIGACLGAWASRAVIRRLGPRAVGFAAAATLGPLLSGIALAGSLPGLCAVLFGLCFLNAVFDVMLNAEAVRAEDAGGGALLSRLHGGYALGLAFGAATGTAAEAASVGLALHLAVFGGVVAVLIAAATPTLSRTLPAPVEHAAGGGDRWTPALLVLTGVAFCAAAAEGVNVDWSALLVVEARGGDRAEGAAGLGAFAVAMTLARFGGDWVTDRLGRLRTIAAGGALGVAGLYVAAFAPNVPLTIAGLALAGVGVAPLFPGLVGLAAAGAGAAEGGVARIAGAAYAAFLIAPASLGWIADNAGLPTVFALCATLLLAGGAIAGATRTLP